MSETKKNNNFNVPLFSGLGVLIVAELIHAYVWSLPKGLHVAIILLTVVLMIIGLLAEVKDFFEKKSNKKNNRH